MTALAWRAGDQIAVQVHPTAIALRRAADGPFRLDGRVQAFIPAGTRALFGLRTGDRVTLVAAPAQDLLLVHPMTVLTDVLASYDASLLVGNHAG
jgi:hypothetical protein